jgi:DNA-binding transcriptional LysR family regulator
VVAGASCARPLTPMRTAKPCGRDTRRWYHIRVDAHIAAGLGVSIVPESLRRPSTEGIAYLTLAKTTNLVAPLHLAWRGASMSGALQRLIAEVREMARVG